MKIRMLITIGLLGLLSAISADAGEKSLAADLKKLDGVWQNVGGIRNGESLTKEQRDALKLVVKGGAYELKVEGKVTEKGKVKFVGQQDKVLFVDFTASEGPNKGKILRGLFEWIGDDALRMTVPMKAGAGRPTMLGGEKGTGQALMIYQQSKD